MLRREIRYALGRCKTGNPDPEHLAVLAKYQPLLDEYELSIQQYMVEWDIHQTRLDELIFGPAVKKSLEEFLPNGPEVKMSYIFDLGEVPFAEPVKTITDEITLDTPANDEVAAPTPPPAPTPKKKKAK